MLISPIQARGARVAKVVAEHLLQMSLCQAAKDFTRSCGSSSHILDLSLVSKSITVVVHECAVQDSISDHKLVLSDAELL